MLIQTSGAIPSSESEDAPKDVGPLEGRTSMASPAEDVPPETQESPQESPKPNKRRREPRLASERQKAFARDLGIEFPADISLQDMSKLIDATLEYESRIDAGEIETHLKTLHKCEAQDMVGEMERRGKFAVLFSWSPPDEADGSYQINVNFSNNLTQEEAFEMAGSVALKARYGKLKEGPSPAKPGTSRASSDNIPEPNEPFNGNEFFAM
jgi:hypothetical protein